MLQVTELLLDLSYPYESILYTGDLGVEIRLVQPLKHLVNGIGTAVVGVEHLHLCCSHGYSTLSWGVCDQVAIPRFSFPHAAHYFLPLLAIEDVLGKYMC